VRRVYQIMSTMTWAKIIAFDICALLALAFVLTLNGAFWPPQKPNHPASPINNSKRIAFSFDDVPRAPGAFLDPAKRPRMLIAALKSAGIKQAVFFANPGRISGSDLHGAAVSAYVNAGHVIANHTENHMSLSSVSAEVFLADVDKAELWLKQQRNYRPWFRFPELDEGRANTAKRDAVRAGLKLRGLRNGYVTADGWDWFMEARARDAVKAGKTIDKAALSALYIETHVESANFSDRLGKRILGRRPVQMLLLHETDLAALYVADLAKALRADGWEIVSADTAYADPMAKMQPEVAFADGTKLEMLAWEKGLVGNRWFPRNDAPEARKLFATRVLHE
jgi:peptidoglycan-N-acetylglucosamine deacetylase